MVGIKRFAVWLGSLLLAGTAFAAPEPQVTDATWVAPDFKFQSGETLQNFKFHYLTMGTPKRDANGHVANAVLMLHGTTNVAGEFLAPSLAGVLFGPGQPLDVTRYYIIIPDGLGRGGSAKPSDGLKAHFPRYGYNDLVLGQYRLVTEGLKIDHLRLVVGVSMGGMNAWQWAERYPDIMDGVMPIACLPMQISGRNLLLRRSITETIRHDPDWNNGDYASQPSHFVYAVPIFNAVTQGVVALQEKAPTFKDGLGLYQTLVDNARKTIDANDYLYAMESSFDYDPEPELGKIKAKVMAVNFADDELNPVALGNFESLVAKAPHSTAVMIPMAKNSNGHFSLLQGSRWAPYLESLIAGLAN